MTANTLSLAPHQVQPSAEVLAFRVSPAAHLAQRLSEGSSEAVSLKEVPFAQLVGLRAKDDDARSALEAVLGAALPTTVGARVALPAGGSVVWLSPDEFLVIAPDAAPGEELLFSRLETALGSLSGQVLDLSANRTILELSGEFARDVLEKTIQLDLHPSVFPVGYTVQTLLENTGIILSRTEENTWQVLPRASFTVHIAGWLLDGMREYAN
ncbi:sarcosine oxidase subunit gamma [Neomicrococcus aestuarii]|uniref:Sarcosine oxidase subunit gamma n=1 Tax=Neomicrococcus aestuarii TaxID=556325 RepID=A0A7W8TU23_9MICC|nr:sarcosine oxidase subunit gamma family protein [Neomicrococcus aestuarii]MBB5512910.1 sarcosine oxidase subunit gamma [Neomicrococcus aestuarii]